MSDALYGVDLFGASAAPKPTGIVTGRFLFAPFTVLDAKQGEWQERKRAWTAMGIKSEVGRGENLAYGSVGILKEKARQSRANAAVGGSKMLSGYDDDGNRQTGLVVESETSIFDPVLCELAYRWFCPAGGQVIDPFAGGSVRGVIAKSLGRRYWGCDLRQEQIEANILQGEEIFDGYDGRSGDIFGVPDLKWVCGDSKDTLADAPLADFVFSCPPYGDLEVYSEDPNDLSTMEWGKFVEIYRVIIARAVARLKNDRFTCFVVGDFRDNRGFYRNFVSTTIAAFEDAGARLYNEAILATSVGSASLRVTKQFNASRKMAKTHQNILVFCKGDPKRAAAACTAEEVATEEP